MARELIEQAIHAELATLMAVFSKEELKDGRARLVRHGHLPEREVLTGDFAEALEALPDPNAKGLSAKTVTRLKADW